MNVSTFQHNEQTYMHRVINTNDLMLFEAQIHENGQDGFRVVGITHTSDDGYVAVMVRPYITRNTHVPDDEVRFGA